MHAGCTQNFLDNLAVAKLPACDLRALNGYRRLGTDKTSDADSCKEQVGRATERGRERSVQNSDVETEGGTQGATEMI